LRLRPLLALALGLLLLALPSFPAYQAGCPIAVAHDLGLLDCPMGADAGSYGISQSAWAALLYEAFAGSVLSSRHEPEEPVTPPESLRAVCSWGWLDTPGSCSADNRYVSRPELQRSMAAVLRTLSSRLPYQSWLARTLVRIRAGVHSVRARFVRTRGTAQPCQATYTEALAMVAEQLAKLRPREGCPSPAPIVLSYYDLLGQAIADWPPAGGSPSVLDLCVGAALANLRRNLEGLASSSPGRTEITDLRIEDIAYQGHLAMITVTRSVCRIHDGRAYLDSGQDTLHLRLTPGGWRIFR